MQSHEGDLSVLMATSIQLSLALSGCRMSAYQEL
jgi:hypothetical protein